MKSEIKYSIIIPTFNRLSVVEKAIDSALSFYEESTKNCEIIIIDDKSTDNTRKLITEKYAYSISNQVIRLIAHDKNTGVVKARNSGAKISRGEWLIFLDSDNELTIGSFKIIQDSSEINPDSPCICFRCQNQEKMLIGEKIIPKKISIDFLLNHKVGELFGVYKKEVYLDIFCDELIEDLRRFESIGVFRALLKYGDFDSCNEVVRIYYEDGDDRLCNSSVLKKQSCLMARGNFVLLKEFWKYMKPKRLVKQIISIPYYKIHCLLRKSIIGKYL